MRVGALARLGAVVAGLGVAGASACGTGSLDLGYDCGPSEPWANDCARCPQNCAGFDGGVDTEAGTPSETCDGRCIPAAMAPFVGPVLFWTGPSPDPASTILTCPEKAPLKGWWYADLEASPITCGACSCEPSAGSCTLPETLTANSAVCPGADSMAAHFSFDPPAGWTGACTAMDALQAGKLCDGLPCVESLTIEPLKVTHGVCATVEAAPAQPPPEPMWGTASILCQGAPFTGAGCNVSGTVCALEAAPGFSHCVYQAGVVGCTLDFAPYTEQHLVYKDKIDTRHCTACSCTPSEGDACTASVSIFKDDACAVPLPFTVPLDALGPKCFDLPKGIGLGSKSASSPVYVPGTCQPGGGEPAGSIDADPATALTLCCIPAPPP
jgi:hypothetical protein